MGYVKGRTPAARRSGRKPVTWCEACQDVHNLRLHDIEILFMLFQQGYCQIVTKDGIKSMCVQTIVENDEMMEMAMVS